MRKLEACSRYRCMLSVCQSQPPKKIYKAENALVTADFLAYLGMVPAEAQNVGTLRCRGTVDAETR